MKKLFLLAACSLMLVALSVSEGHAQRYAIIDTKYILDKMPEYKTAQKNLDDIAAKGNRRHSNRFGPHVQGL